MSLYAQAFKTSEVCPIFWASFFALWKRKDHVHALAHMQNTQHARKIARAMFYCKLLQADLLELHWNSNLQSTEIRGICVSQPLALAPGSNLFLAAQVRIYI